jgi:hypothetical protein
LRRTERGSATKIDVTAAVWSAECWNKKMRAYDITSETPAGTFIKTVVGEKFSIRMPEACGRIIEPWLGRHKLVDHTCRTEGDGFVTFDMIALKAGNDLVEFPLIEVDWDGASDPDPEKAEPYACILVVVLQKRGVNAAT